MAREPPALGPAARCVAIILVSFLLSAFSVMSLPPRTLVLGVRSRGASRRPFLRAASSRAGAAPPRFRSLLLCPGFVSGPCPCPGRGPVGLLVFSPVFPPRRLPWYPLPRVGARGFLPVSPPSSDPWVPLSWRAGPIVAKESLSLSTARGPGDRARVASRCFVVPSDCFRICCRPPPCFGVSCEARQGECYRRSERQRE